MPVIEWIDEFNIGIECIDSQHRQLVSMINNLYEVIRSNKDRHPAIKKSLDALIDYINVHFSLEQNFMDRICYPKRFEHVEIHKWISIQVVSLCDSYEKDKNSLLAEELFEFLSDWFVKHIKSEDLLIKSFLDQTKTQGY